MLDSPPAETTFLRGTPASADLVARAESLVKAHPECFWFWHPDAKVVGLEGVRLVVRTLRQYGDHTAWSEAQALHKCLSRNSKKES